MCVCNESDAERERERGVGFVRESSLRGKHANTRESVCVRTQGKKMVCFVG